MQDICVNFIDPDLFLIPQGTLPWQPMLGKIGEMTFIQHAHVPKSIQISQFQFATLCAISVKIGPLTPEIMSEVSVTFETRRQKLT